MFEYQVDVIIRRYEPTGNILQEPEEIKVYESNRFIDGDNGSRLNDILDSSKSNALEAIQKDIQLHCTHEGLEDDDAEVCMVCMRSRDEIEAEIAADDYERRIDAEIDNAKL